MNNKNLSMKKRYALFVKRTQYYLSQGYDRFKAAEFVANFAEDLRSPALDVGAGKGIFSIALAKRGLSVIGIDINEYDLEFANYLTQKEKLKKKIKFYLLDAKLLPFESKSFKTVAMMDVLHHIEKEDGQKILNEMVRVLSDNGKLIIAEFDEEGFEIVAKAHEREGTIHHRGYWTLEKASNFLKQNGMELLSQFNSHFNYVHIFQRNAKVQKHIRLF